MSPPPSPIAETAVQHLRIDQLHLVARRLECPYDEFQALAARERNGLAFYRGAAGGLQEWPVRHRISDAARETAG